MLRIANLVENILDSFELLLDRHRHFFGQVLGARASS
jgi:hypothetical protein